MGLQQKIKTRPNQDDEDDAKQTIECTMSKKRKNLAEPDDIKHIYDIWVIGVNGDSEASDEVAGCGQKHGIGRAFEDVLFTDWK